MEKYDLHLSGTGSPGNGMTVAQLSKDPLATEGEATPGPDEYNPFDDERQLRSEAGGIGDKRRMKPEQDSEGPRLPAPEPGFELDIDGPGGLPPLFGGE